MTALTQKERSARAAAKRAARGEVELRAHLGPGIFAMIDNLMKWGEIKERTELIQLLIMNAHAAGPDGSAPMLAVPRHDLGSLENVARKLYKAGAAEAARLDRAEA